MKTIQPPQTETEAQQRLEAHRKFGHELRDSLAAQKRFHAALEAYENDPLRKMGNSQDRTFRPHLETKP